MKKRLISMAVAAMMSCCAMPLTTSAEDNIIDTTPLTLEEALAAGYDFNGDGTVSRDDVDLLLTYYCNLALSYYRHSGDLVEQRMDADVIKAIEANGDVDGDGKIYPQDACLILIRCDSFISNKDNASEADIDDIVAAAMKGASDIPQLTAEEALAVGYDFNGDGIVSYRDANLVQQYSAFLMMEVSSDEILEEMGADVVEAIEANGDINGDGKINPVDVTNMLQTCIDIIKNGDVNEDGVVDPTDASLILECYSKKSLGDSYNDRYTEMAISFIGDIDGIQGLTPSDASAVLQKYVENSMQ